MVTIYANYGQSRVILTWIPDNKLPSIHLITSVHGFCFYDCKLLLVNLKERGWDIPGGHVESGETPEESFRREAMEEAYVEGDCHLLGYIKVDHSENLNWTEDSKYPKIGYQPFYYMKISKMYTFDAKYESSQRTFIGPDEIKDYYSSWNELFQEILNSALALERKR